ncbi:HlyD family efflux transporter periplasmic adaptor subunit [Palleronia sediminis]|uniref:HlyD family efflux transporter periplasmic adaptor subunit n=1 Tax=Palleronia sediminis TaxID=2547833 RepID=A0A4V3BA57_9RHOB|nr:HlyD family efflux transporter periplasmic adaptor subunit [Palleronia sediminis]TDL81599.1 HlyD family efflux transporter periplasmic adaptor subunit [Palleronia sediminis]
MRFLRRALTGLFLVSLTAGLLALAGGTVRSALEERANREIRPRQAEERVYAANVVPFASGDAVPVLSTFGRIESRRSLQVRAATAGRVVEMGPGVEEGGSVDAGQLLFRIDPVAAERGLAVARTDLADAEAELADARRALDLARDDLETTRAQVDLRDRALARQRDLSERGINAAAAVEEAELALQTARQAVLSRRQALAAAEARIASAETALERRRIALDDARRLLGDTEITARFGGRLADVTATEGGLVSANEQLATLVDPEALEVVFRVSTQEYARLRGEGGPLADTAAEVSLEVGDLAIESPATITREAAAVAEGETGRRLYARLAAPEGFRPGDFVRVRVAEPELAEVAWLPAAAVDSAGGVLVLGADDRLELATVELLRRQGDTVLVRAPDLDGREVVAERSPLLGAGIKVRPLRPEDRAARTAAPPAEDLVELSAERRASLIARVEGDDAMAEDDKARMLTQLRAERVPAGVVARIEGSG